MLARMQKRLESVTDVSSLRFTIEKKDAEIDELRKQISYLKHHAPDTLPSLDQWNPANAPGPVPEDGPEQLTPFSGPDVSGHLQPRSSMTESVGAVSFKEAYQGRGVSRPTSFGGGALHPSVES